MALMIWDESTRDELCSALPYSLVILPTGATEQHGPHLVTGHDTFVVSDIARRAAELAANNGSIVLAPSLAFGSSHHHLPFGGTLSLSTETYYRVVHDLVDSIITAGARRIFLLNGHGGNQELNQLVARDVVLSQKEGIVAVVGAASYWDIAYRSVTEDSFLHNMIVPGHAGQFETSTLLATAPNLVREPLPNRAADSSRQPSIPGVRIEFTGQWQSFEGYTDFPDRATVELGDRILGHVIRNVAAAIIAFANFAH